MLNMQLRQKAQVSTVQSDLDIFQGMEMWDPWVDAQMPGLFVYLYLNDKLVIPSTWEPTMALFYNQMKGYVAGLKILHVTYS